MAEIVINRLNSENVTKSNKAPEYGVARSGVPRRLFLLGAAGAATGGLGSPFIQTAKAAESVKIGLSFAHAGIQGPGGPHVKAGAELAVSIHGGMVLGRPIELVVSDETDVPGTKANMNKLITEQKVVAVVGGSESSRSIALQAIAGEAKIPLIIHTSSHDDLSGKLCNPWTFRVSIPYGIQYRAISPYLADYGKKWFMLGVTGTSGPAMMAVAKLGMTEEGAQEIGSEVASQELTDFSAIIDKIKTTKPDVVVGALQGTALTYFFKAWQAGGVGTQIPYAQIGLTDADLWAAGPEAAAATGGVYSKTWDYAAPNLPADDKVFVEQFLKKMNGQPPDTRAWQAYMGMRSLLGSIELVKSTEADKIRQAIPRFQEASGAVTLRFRDHDHQMLHRVPVFETKTPIKDKYHWLDAEKYLPEKVSDLDQLYGPKDKSTCIIPA